MEISPETKATLLKLLGDGMDPEELCQTFNLSVGEVSSLLLELINVQNDTEEWEGALYEE